MPKLLKIALLLLLVLAVIGAGVAATLYRATQQVPDFYEHALQLEPETMKKAGDELERRMLALQNDIHQDGHWQAVFTVEQINGWLAADLDEKFPGLLPNGVQDPRVAIVDGQLRVACRHEGSGLNAIISFTLEPYLTQNPNEVAVRIRELRAGSLPLPMTKALERISKAANRADLRLQWAQEDDDPVALLTLPSSRPELRRNYRVDELAIEEGAIVVTGHTQADSPDGSQGSAGENVEMAEKPQHSVEVKVNANDVR